MQFIRSIKDRANPYVQINKNVFDDPLLSLKAKGFIGYCLSKPDNWVFHVEQLATVLKEKEKSLYNTIKECIDMGYAIRWRKRHANGCLESWQTIISDSKEEILKIKHELNSDRSVQSSFATGLKNKVPHRPFGDVDNAGLEKGGTNKNEENKNDLNKIVIAKPDPAPPPAEAMPAGGNNNKFIYKCLSLAIDLSNRQKAELTKRHPEAAVAAAIKYCYHPTTKIEGGPVGRLKLLLYFLKNPDLFADKMLTIDTPEEKKTAKETTLGRFKHGEMYNGFEFLVDDKGIGFLKPGMVHVYSVYWGPNFNNEFLQLINKLGINNGI